MVTMKPLRAFAPILLVSALLLGCSSNAPTNMDSSEAESLLQQYYTAFNSYDIKLIEGVFTKRAWQEEKVSLKPLVYWAESKDFKPSLLSIDWIEIDEGAVKVRAEATSNLGSWDDYFYFVVEDGGWKIDRLITRDLSKIQSLGNTTERISPRPSTTGPSCCPGG